MSLIAVALTVEDAQDIATALESARAEAKRGATIVDGAWTRWRTRTTRLKVSRCL